jgi:hypothetical protein
VTHTPDLRAKLGARGYRYWLLGQVLRYLPDTPDDTEGIRKAYYYLYKLATDERTKANDETPLVPPLLPPQPDDGRDSITHPGVAGDVVENVNRDVWSAVVYPGDFDAPTANMPRQPPPATPSQEKDQ